MNDAVDHLGAVMHTEQTDDKNPKAVAQDPKWNDKSDQRDTAPRSLQEEMRHEEAGDEKNQTRANSAAFLRDLDNDTRQLEDRTIPYQRGTGNVKEEIGRVGRRQLGSRFQPENKLVGEWDQENQERERKPELAHPGFPEKHKSAGSDKGNKRKDREGEVVVGARRGEESPVGHPSCEGGRADGKEEDAPGETP